MFVTLAPRLATSFAITVGTVAGGVLALMHTPPPTDLVPETPRLESARGPVTSAVQSSQVRVPARPPAPAVSVPASPSEASRDLTPSPHDSPLPTEAELRKSERLCIRDLPDECVRAADAFLAGVVVERDKTRAAQYRNLAFNGYIRACENNQPEACYSLARIYLHGDGVRANPAYAENLMRRVVEVCRYKKAAICQRLMQEAPMPPKAKRR